MAVLSWNEILQKDKQTQMTGAQGLTPEQLGALREAELTEGAVNARNIFNQNEINRRNAVAEKNASDMLSANKRAQNMEAVIKLGMMAKEYYPAITGAYDSATGAKSVVTPYSTESISNALSQETGTGQGVSIAGSVGSGAAVSSPISSYAVGSEGAGTTLSTLGSGEMSAGTMTGDAGVSAVGTGSSAISSISSGVSTAAPYYAAAKMGGQLARDYTASNEWAEETPFGQLGGSLEYPVTGVERYWGLEAARHGWGNETTGKVFGYLTNPLSWTQDLGGGCIIVTACTDRHSYEVEITRQYRDKFLTGTQLRGYYCLAEKLVPTLVSNEKIRKFTKKHLVNRLVDYGEMKLGLKEKCKLSSKIVSNLFLGLIKTVGFFIPKYTRLNGEIY